MATSSVSSLRENPLDLSLTRDYPRLNKVVYVATVFFALLFVAGAAVFGFSYVHEKNTHKATPIALSGVGALGILIISLICSTRGTSMTRWHV